MGKAIVMVILLAFLVLVVSCTTTDYVSTLKQQIETDNVTPIQIVTPPVFNDNQIVVNFNVTNQGVSVDKVVNIGNFYKGAEADVVYLIRNESNIAVTPMIYFVKDTRIDKYSKVVGQGYKDAPAIVEKWVTVSPKPFPIPPKTTQGFIVAFAMPKDAKDVPQKFAFQVGVAVGDKVQLAVAPWWLVIMR